MVVVAGMNALDGFRQEWNDVAVGPDVVVVAALAVLCLTAGNQGFHAERAGGLAEHGGTEGQVPVSDRIGTVR